MDPAEKRERRRLFRMGLLLAVGMAIPAVLGLWLGLLALFS